MFLKLFFQWGSFDIGLIRVGASPEFTTVTSTMSRLNFRTPIKHCAWGEIAFALDKKRHQKTTKAAKCSQKLYKVVKIHQKPSRAIKTCQKSQITFDSRLSRPELESPKV